jgi:hypothetical protein
VRLVAAFGAQLVTAGPAAAFATALALTVPAGQLSGMGAALRPVRLGRGRHSA